MSFSSVNEVECHVRWQPVINGSISSSGISRLRSSLQLRLDNEPGLQGLHRVSLAYLSLLEKDSAGCEQNLEEARWLSGFSGLSDPAPVPVAFLIEAMRLHLLHELHPCEQAEQEMLQQLWRMWQLPSVQAACWGAKGCTLLSFGRERNDEAMRALRRAMKLEHEAGLEKSFHWAYGLALAMARQQRRLDLSSELGEEKVELWDEAKQLLDAQGKQHPVFLARYAEAIAYSSGQFSRCEELADEAARLSSKQDSRYFEVYSICPKVYRSLKKMARWSIMAGVNSVVNRLADRELEVLTAGVKVFHSSTDEFLKSNFALQYAQYYIKTAEGAGEDRYAKAREWLSKASPSNIFATLRLLVLDETQNSTSKEEILSRYEELAAKAESQSGAQAKMQIEFELSRFLLVRCHDPDSVTRMKAAIEHLPSRFTSSHNRRQILSVLRRIPTAAAEDKKWIADRLVAQTSVPGHFPQSMVLQGFRWRLACSGCTEQLDVLGSRFRVICSVGLHDCAETELLVKMLGDDAAWSLVRPRPIGRAKSIGFCDKYQPSNGDNRCRRAQCGAAHGKAEWQLWELERTGVFSLAGFLLRVRQAQTCQQRPLLVRRRSDGQVVFLETNQTPRRPPVLPKVAVLCASHFSAELPKLTAAAAGKGVGHCLDPEHCEFAHALCEERLWNRVARDHPASAGKAPTDEQWQAWLEQQLPLTLAE